MVLGGCLCFPAAPSRVEPFPVFPCAAGGSANETTATPGGPGGPTVPHCAGKPRPAGSQPLRTALKSADDASCRHRGAAFDILAAAGAGSEPCPLPPAPLSATAAIAGGDGCGSGLQASKAQLQRPARTSQGGPGAASCGQHHHHQQQQQPHQHRLAAVSQPGINGYNGTNGNTGNKEDSGEVGGANGMGNASGVSAGSKPCFSESGNGDGFADADIEYDEEMYDNEHMYDCLVPPGASEPGECRELQSDGGGYPYDNAADECPSRMLSGATAVTSSSYAAAAAAAAALQCGGGGSGGGPTRSAKSNCSSWSVKVMSDLQLAPDRHGRIRLPSILMFTHRRPPRDARTEAWWTKIRGVFVDTGRSMTSSLGQRSRRRAHTGGTEDGGGTACGGGDVVSGSCGGGVEDEDDDVHGALSRPSAVEPPPPPPKRSTDGRPPQLPPSRGGSRPDIAVELARSRSGAPRSQRSEAGTAAAAAAAPPPPPPLGAGPGLPGAVAAAETSASDLGRRPCRPAAGGSSSSAGEADGGGGGKGLSRATDAAKYGAPGPQPTGSSIPGGDGSGGGGGSGSGSPRATCRSRSRSKGVSRSGSGHAGGADLGDSVAADAAEGYSPSVHAYARQPPPLGMAFAAGDAACEAPAEAPWQTRTPTEEVRCGSAAVHRPVNGLLPSPPTPPTPSAAAPPALRRVPGQA